MLQASQKEYQTSVKFEVTNELRANNPFRIETSGNISSIARIAKHPIEGVRVSSVEPWGTFENL